MAIFQFYPLFSILSFFPPVLIEDLAKKTRDTVCFFFSAQPSIVARCFMWLHFEHAWFKLELGREELFDFVPRVFICLRDYLHSQHCSWFAFNLISVRILRNRKFDLPLCDVRLLCCRACNVLSKVKPSRNKNKLPKNFLSLKVNRIVWNLVTRQWTMLSFPLPWKDDFLECWSVGS